MIKKIHEITLKDILLLDETGKADHLKRFRIVPFWMLKKQIEKLTKSLFEKIGGETADDIDDKFNQIFEYNKLQILQALYSAAYASLFMQSQINVFKVLIDGKIEEHKETKEILEKIKEYTGIDIQKPDDFTRFKKKLEFLRDKYEEKYSKPEQTDQKRDITEVIYSYFHYWKEPYNENMRLVTFAKLKNLADQKIRQSKQQNDG